MGPPISESKLTEEGLWETWKGNTDNILQIPPPAQRRHGGDILMNNFCHGYRIIKSKMVKIYKQLITCIVQSSADYNFCCWYHTRRIWTQNEYWNLVTFANLNTFNRWMSHRSVPKVGTPGTQLCRNYSEEGIKFCTFCFSAPAWNSGDSE